MNDNIIDKKEVRYASLKDALASLKEVKEKYFLNEDESIRKIFVDAAIQRFEFTFELMWKVLKDYMQSMGFSDFSLSPKRVLKFAFKNAIIDDESAYTNMLIDRNSTMHMYDEKLANEIFDRIVKNHIGLIDKVIKYLEKENYCKLS